MNATTQVLIRDRQTASETLAHQIEQQRLRHAAVSGLEHVLELNEPAAESETASIVKRCIVKVARSELLTPERPR